MRNDEGKILVFSGGDGSDAHHRASWDLEGFPGMQLRHIALLHEQRIIEHEDLLPPAVEHVFLDIQYSFLHDVADGVHRQRRRDVHLRLLHKLLKYRDETMHRVFLAQSPETAPRLPLRS